GSHSLMKADDLVDGVFGVSQEIQELPLGFDQELVLLHQSRSNELSEILQDRIGRQSGHLASGGDQVEDVLVGINTGGKIKLVFLPCLLQQILPSGSVEFGFDVLL